MVKWYNGLTWLTVTRSWFQILNKRFLAINNNNCHYKIIFYKIKTFYYIRW